MRSGAQPYHLLRLYQTLTPLPRSYVAELRSLVELYSNPLLHPLIKTPSHSPATRFGFSPEPPQTLSPASSSSADLPIASRFARSPDLYSSPGPSHEDLSRSAAAVRIADVPEIPDDTLRPSASTSSTSGPLGRSSLPNLPTGARRNLSSTTLDPQSGLAPVSSTSLGTRIASAFKTRHPLRPASSAAKLHRAPTHAPQEVLQPPPLPEALKKVLEATIEMLRGHEELSARLCVGGALCFDSGVTYTDLASRDVPRKEQWARAFPLVRCVVTARARRALADLADALAVSPLSGATNLGSSRPTRPTSSPSKKPSRSSTPVSPLRTRPHRHSARGPPRSGRSASRAC